MGYILNACLKLPALNILVIALKVYRFPSLDCRHLSGTRGYCDKEGIRKLKRVIAGYPAEGIHFIDSGNYHYLTKLWTDKLRVPFSLIVFDHHPDMQPPLFKGMLSCGSWVKDMLDWNMLCKKVVIVGASDKLIRTVPEEYGQRVSFYSEATLAHEAITRFNFRIPSLSQ